MGEWRTLGKAAERKERAKAKDRTFIHGETFRLLRTAEEQNNWNFVALIRLGVLCAMDASSIGSLEAKHIDGNWLSQPRGKTGIIRTAYVDDVTLEAIAKASKSDEGPMFRTQRGNPWRSEGAFGHAFKTLRDASGVKSQAGFHAFRRGFAGVANTLPAEDSTIRHVMAHTQGMLHEVYVGKPDRVAIKSLCDGVLFWLEKNAAYQDWLDIRSGSLDNYTDAETGEVMSGVQEVMESYENQYPFSR